jgi:hypothetical protein
MTPPIATPETSETDRVCSPEGAYVGRLNDICSVQVECNAPDHELRKKVGAIVRRVIMVTSSCSH